jgi:hypothetical protein
MVMGVFTIGWKLVLTTIGSCTSPKPTLPSPFAYQPYAQSKQTGTARFSLIAKLEIAHRIRLLGPEQAATATGIEK